MIPERLAKAVAKAEELSVDAMRRGSFTIIYVYRQWSDIVQADLFGTCTADYLYTDEFCEFDCRTVGEVVEGTYQPY